MSTVLVTGASGYLALHIISQLLEKNYTVIGTVRSQSKADKVVEGFQEKFGSKVGKLSFAIVEDISDLNAFDNVIKDHQEINYVLHTASPLPSNYTDYEKSYLIPAKNGTLGILNAVKKYGPNVSKVVVTSSFASIMDVSKISDSSFIHDESSWNPLTEKDATNDSYAYAISKKLAERAAWDFVKNEDVKFTLTTVTPPYVLGPQCFEGHAASDSLNSSNQIFKRFVHSKPGDEVSVQPGKLAVHVHDVAAFHVFPLEKTGLDGHRLFPVSETFNEQQVLNIINDKFPQLKGKIATGQPEVADKVAKCGFSNKKTVELLGGYNFIPLEKQVVDAVQQILDAESK